jgi:hypothetical protein
MTDFNDSLDALFAGDTGPVRTAPVRAPASFAPAVDRSHTEPCAKCGGSGRFVGYTGRVLGDCFTCKGTGKKTFKNSAADRETNRNKVTARKVARQQEDFTVWQTANPAEATWLVDTAARWPLAASLLEAVQKYGDLTEKQLAVVRNGMARDAARAEARAVAVTEAPAVDTAGIDRLKAAFDVAAANSAARGLKLSPRITIDGVTISPAKATSANAGALYVKSGGEYLGKIKEGRFMAVGACTTEQKDKILSFIADPQEAAKVYGQTTGTCCICNATLKSEWKHRGIGPVCAEKWGWA